MTMSSASLIQLFGACIGIIGSLFFAIGVMRQTVDAMANLSGTYFDWNPHMPPALAAQKADYLFGGGLILFAFVLQLASFFFSQAPFLTAQQSVAAPWAAGLATALAFLALRIAARKVAGHFEKQIWARLKQSQGQT